MLNADRLGWAFVAPTLVKDSLGNILSPTRSSPALIRKAVLRDHRHLHEQYIAGKLGYAGDRVALTITQEALAKVGRKESNLPLAFLGGGAIRTKQRLACYGYNVHTKCQFCDGCYSLEHHLLECTATKGLREKMLEEHTLTLESSRAGLEGPLLAGFLIHGISREMTQGTGVSPGQVHLLDFGMEGQPHEVLFVDGSCTRHVIPELSTTGWSVVEITKDGEARKVWWWTVGSALPHLKQLSSLHVCMHAP